MVRNALAIAVAGALSLSAPAFAADAQAAASSAAVKAVKVERTSAVSGATNQLYQGPDASAYAGKTFDEAYWIFLAFGIVLTAVMWDAINDDHDPVSP